LAKEIGQLAGWDCTGTSVDECGIKFTVTAIEVGPKCYQYGTPAAAGRKTILLRVSMTTGTLTADGAALGPSIFNPYSLKGISSDGFVHEAQPGGCTDYQGRLATNILPNAKYEGTVEIEIPESVTSVASANQVPSRDGGRGWVWKIPG
jgi:hypothetical protein